MNLGPDAKIIIADDTIPMLIALRRALVQLGYANIIEAENGEEAFAALKVNPDTQLIISDWNMSPMDGLELLTAVRAGTQFQKLRFILVSADAAGVRVKALEAGATHVLAKPFGVEKLREIIRAI